MQFARNETGRLKKKKADKTKVRKNENKCENQVTTADGRPCS